jgi:hypothetical protein
MNTGFNLYVRLHFSYAYTLRMLKQVHGSTYLPLVYGQVE